MDDLEYIRSRRDSRKLAATIRHAALHATPRELLDLDRLLILVRNQHLTKAEAIEQVEALRRTQDQRRQAA